MYKIINKILKERKISKKDFAKNVINREPILKRTKEVPTIQAIYKYLDGTREPEKSVVEAMIDVLDITAIDLFENAKKRKQQILKSELKNPAQETQILLENYCTQKNFNNSVVGSENVVLGDNNTTNSHNAPQELNHRALTLLDIFNDKNEQEQKEILKIVMGI